MKLSTIVSSVLLVLLIGQAQANSNSINIENNKEEASFWLDKMKLALTTSNFDAGIVTTLADKTKSSKWSHGVLESGVEVESLSPLIGGDVVTIRRNNIISYIEPNKQAYSVTGNNIKAILPSIFYQDVSALLDSYRFVLVSKNQIADRVTQLIRIESIEGSSYNYWLWVDVESGLPLRMAHVNNQGNVIEQTLMSHLTLMIEPSEQMNKLGQIELPMPAVKAIASNQEMNDWQISWLPKGFELIKSDRHHVSISREISDYYLYSDGLVEFSVYIQRPLDSYKSPIVLAEGATSFVMNRADGYDVTVVGKVPPKTAVKIAQGVKSNRQ